MAEVLHPGETNVLTVLIHPAPALVRDAIARGAGEWPVMTAMRQAYPRWKCPTNAGWDWGAKIITMGIWKEVKLIASDGVRLSNLIVQPSLSAPYDRARLHTQMEISSSAHTPIELVAQVHCLTVPDSPIVATQVVNMASTEHRATMSVAVPHPRLWWPNGYGQQHLYQLTVTARPLGGDRELDRIATTFGIRDLQMLPNPESPDNQVYIDYTTDRAVSHKLPQPPPERRYLIQINGRRIFGRGGNWIPCDLLYGRPRGAFYERLIRQAAQANFNLFRMWGGGLIEKPEFYELCDRYGIMLFQEFPNAGARLPETDEALAIAAEETRQILPLLINHPCIVRYGGGNEWYRNAENSRQMAQLRRICHELDPTRPFHDPDPECIAQRHGPHGYDWAQHYRTYNTGYPLTAGPDNPLEWTEYGASGAASVETLRQIIPTEHLWPIQPSDPYWGWHKAFGAYGADNWMASAQYHHLFGDLPDLETTVRCSQFVQAEALRYADQAMRRFQWHRSACASWTYNEPWPNAAHGCIVEFYGRPKMAYYYTGNAYAPVDVSAEYDSLLCQTEVPFPLKLFVTSTRADRLQGCQFIAQAVDVQGREYAKTNWTLAVVPDATLPVGTWNLNVPAEAKNSVVLVQLRLLNTKDSELAAQTYTFGVVGHESPNQADPLKVPTLSADGRRNLALRPGAKAAASSVIAGYAIHQIAHLNDGWYGNSASWIAGESPAWAEIDLGTNALISRVCVGNDHTRKFTDRGTAEFRILVATQRSEHSNAASWKTVAHYQGDPLQGTKVFDLDPVEARWIRIDIIKGTEARIDEIEVYAAEPFTGDRAVAEAAAVRGPAPAPSPSAQHAGYLRPLLTAPTTGLELSLDDGKPVSRYGSASRVFKAKIRNRSAVPALFVALDLDPVDGVEGQLSDNYFTLLGNAAKTVEIMLIGSPPTTGNPARLRLRARAWNSAEVSQMVVATVPPPAEPAIPYGVATNVWPEPFGNHRARIRVDHPADAVWVHLPWRRRDLDPEKKNVVVVDLTTGQTITNVVCAQIHREFGDLVFQPVTVPGEYGVYYLPCKYTGSSYFPNTVYDAPVETADAAWKERWELTPAGLAAGHWQRLPRAHVLQFEARSEFHRFDPMEVIATPDEIQSLLAQHSERDYLLFPEDRRFPIRMTDDIPLRWVTNRLTGSFAGNVRPGEFYTFQVGLYAARRSVKNVRVTFNDLVSADAKMISASALRCFNLGGTNWLGRPFTKQVNVPQGKVQALWFGVQIPPKASGLYTGMVRLSADELVEMDLKLQLTIEGKPLADAGDSELWRQSRLRWLDSTIGLDDDVVSPYAPVKINGRTLTVMGRNVTLADTGLPSVLSSTFTEAVDSIEGAERLILARPMAFVVATPDGAVAWQGGSPRITARHPGSVSWESESAGADLKMRCQGKLDCDGYINYTVTLRARRETDVNDVRLEIPFRSEVAKYMMGLGCKGGKRPSAWQWKWDINRANNVVWLGDVNAGLHCKLKGAGGCVGIVQFEILRGAG